MKPIAWRLTQSARGASVVEVLVALTLTSIIIAGIGNLMTTLGRREMASAMKEHALAYAREYLEVMADVKNGAFACTCATDSCTADTCTRSSDGLTCKLPDGYTSCWTDYPDSLSASCSGSACGPLYLDHVSGNWVLTDSEPPPPDPAYSRHLSIENRQRDANGDLVESGGMPDPSTKEITATIEWNERGNPKSLSISTFMTGWESL